jgi:hypothetical protein
MPAYWFMYNMYALSRNAHKYQDRDKRTEKIQKIEFDFLGPDTINEMFEALHILESLQTNEKDESSIKGWENSKRKTIVIKVSESILAYKQMIVLYAGNQILELIKNKKIQHFVDLKKHLSFKSKRNHWINIGGQLIQEKEVERLKNNIKNNKINSWNKVHQFYIAQGKNYENDKLNHAVASLSELWKISSATFTPIIFKKLLEETLNTKSIINDLVFETRRKDYTNPFRKMTYENQSEMNIVLGNLENNSFINEQRKEFNSMKKGILQILKKWKLN